MQHLKLTNFCKYFLSEFWHAHFYGNDILLKIFKKCPFRRACLAGDLQKMKELHEKNQNLELHVDKSGWNGLHHAAAAGQVCFYDS